MTNVDRKIKAVFQLAALAWLMGWYIKGKFFHQYLLFHIYAYPIFHAQFPPFFQDPAVAPLPIICRFYVSRESCCAGSPCIN